MLQEGDKARSEIGRVLTSCFTVQELKTIRVKSVIQHGLWSDTDVGGDAHVHKQTAQLSPTKHFPSLAAFGFSSYGRKYRRDKVYSALEKNAKKTNRKLQPILEQELGRGRQIQRREVSTARDGRGTTDGTNFDY